MRLYEAHALGLALETIASLDLGAEAARVTHLLVTSCTGFYAPGLDLQIIERLGLSPAVERTMIGFMGCQAAIPALKLAAHIVRAQPAARVLTVHLELCTIHLQETDTLESLLSFVLFADGCAASLVSAEPAGLEITGFRAAVLPASAEQITWRVGDQGFLMWLDGAVPGTIARGLPTHVAGLLGGRAPRDLGLWAVHPGGRSVLDAVEDSLGLPAEHLDASRGVLRDYGNMSSPTVMFVLGRLLGQGRRGEDGAALAFGPGLTAEAMTFRVAEGAWPT
jgi:predicted naringenin-chalcone synthase